MCALDQQQPFGTIDHHSGGRDRVVIIDKITVVALAHQPLAAIEISPLQFRRTTRTETISVEVILDFGQTFRIEYLVGSCLGSQRFFSQCHTLVLSQTHTQLRVLCSQSFENNNCTVVLWRVDAIKLIDIVQRAFDN